MAILSIKTRYLTVSNLQPVGSRSKNFFEISLVRTSKIPGNTHVMAILQKSNVVLQYGSLIKDRIHFGINIRWKTF